MRARGAASHDGRTSARSGIWPILLATLIGTAILVTLGVWQVQRLHWKEALLAQLAANAAAAPVDLPTAAARGAKARTRNSCG